jgi:pyroglutamyl-peptidase
MMSVHPALVTGFAPYAGRGRNPAADIANALDGRSIAEVPIVGRLLPVALDEIAA